MRKTGFYMAAVLAVSGMMLWETPAVTYAAPETGIENVTEDASAGAEDATAGNGDQTAGAAENEVTTGNTVNTESGVTAETGVEQAEGEAVSQVLEAAPRKKKGKAAASSAGGSAAEAQASAAQAETASASPVLSAPTGDEEIGGPDPELQQAAEAEAQAAAEAERKAGIRQSVVNLALQFVGRPYRSGGNDPHTGADCSGFVRYVMQHGAGVLLNRSSSSQATQGQPISASQIQPGDLVFYGNGSRISHVAMYIGDGKIVHASTYKTGIKVSNWNYRSPLKIVSFLG